MKSQRLIFVALRRLTLALLGAVVAAQNSQSQQPNPPASKDQYTYRIETELVQLDLTVTDKQGKPVPGLKREDFELYEDGKKQTLTHFAVGTAQQPAGWLTPAKTRAARVTPAIEPSTTAAGTVGRYIVLAVDDFHLAPANLIFVKRALTKFITEQMVAGDQIALVTTSGKVGLFQQFTQERTVLERAINRLMIQERQIADPNSLLNLTEYQAELIELGDQAALQLAVAELARRESELLTNAPAVREGWEYRVRAQARMVLAMSANYTQATLDMLEGVTRSLQPLVGRKLLVLLSDGFFLGGTGVYTKRLDLQRLTDAATRAGVMIYSVDARGLATVTPGGDASEYVELDIAHANTQTRLQLAALNAKRDGLFALAAATGGTLFFNSNDLNLGLQRVLDANETYYVLAYEPPASRRDGRFHKIEVRVAGRPELKVRTRNGYLAPDETAEKSRRQAEEKQQERLKKLPPEKREQELNAEQEKRFTAALGALWPLREVPIETTTDFMEMQGFSGAIFNTHINAANLAFEEHQGRHRAVVELGGYVFDERGKIAASFNERINLNSKPETLSQIIRLGFNHRRLLELKPGFYQARVVVREAKTGRLGSAFNWLEVPDLSKQQLALSGIFLTEPGQSALQDLSNTPAKPNEAYTPRPASASRRFKTGGDMDFLLFVYNAKAENSAVELTTQAQLYSGSTLVYASPPVKMAVTPDTDLRRIPYAARVPLKGYPPGAYELRVAVTDLFTKTTAQQQVNFTVE